MSTSPSRAPAGHGLDPPGPTPQPFPYAALPEKQVQRAVDPVFPGEAGNQDSADAAIGEALARSRAQGQAEARKLFEDQLARERASLAAALAQFSRDRGIYFQKVESEVVQLALAIARKILHREAQVDPLLLVGIVRVALEKIDGATTVVLRLHPQNASDWRGYLATQLDPAHLPEIVEDASQSPDSCTLETSMGQTSLGLDVQMKEIEQGLLDLLAARPGVSP